jgi:hypothetical protein
MHFLRDFAVYLAWLAVAGVLISGEVAALDQMLDPSNFELAVLQ